MSDLANGITHYAIRNDDGSFGVPYKLDGPIMLTSTCDEPVDNPFIGRDILHLNNETLSLELCTYDGKAVSDIIARGPNPSLSLVFERMNYGKYRHDHVWRYRMERKGNKANRRRCNRRRRNRKGRSYSTVITFPSVRLGDVSVDALTSHKSTPCKLTFTVNQEDA